jgi:translation elongation factor EF-1alpha
MMPTKKMIGKIEHYYPHISVAVITLTDSLKVGEKILIERTEHSFEQVVSSMQVEHKNISAAKKGDSVGLKVDQPTKEGAKVYKIVG